MKKLFFTLGILLLTSPLLVGAVWDIEEIYGERQENKYPLPKGILESYLSGKAFDHPVFYTEEEKLALKKDIYAIFHDIISTCPPKEKLAILTAGAPGAGKTTKLNQDREANRLKGKNYAYICPDDVCLKKQQLTYQLEIKKGDLSKEARQNAYNKWRPASNAATHLILVNLIREGFGFYFGTTSTSPSSSFFYEFLKKEGYRIRVIHVSAPDEVRWESIKERDKVFIQTTEQDVREKGLLLPQRIMDTYLAYADQIEFYYRDKVNQDALLAATWTRNGNVLKVHSPSNYNKIKTIHNLAVEKLGRPDLKWEVTVENGVLPKKNSW